MLKMVYGGTEADYEQIALESGIPDYMAGALYRYVEHGISGGGFLHAVLCNDLKGAFGSADVNNAQCLKEWCIVMMWCVPNGCQGSAKIVDEWKKKKKAEKEGEDGRR